ncbi:MAG: general stress protein [Chloroflexota bacterium]|nr:general stress protein [Chloroflexota bacterium]
MPKAHARLYKDPLVAKRAVEELQANGFKADEIGVLVHEAKRAEGFGTNPTKVQLPEAGSAVALGAMATSLPKGDEAETALALGGLLGLPEEAILYYDFSVSVGGILLSVHADESRLAQARDIMRGVDSLPASPWNEPATTNPTFEVAERMLETNPIDAPMSGDFRKY